MDFKVKGGKLAFKIKKPSLEIYYNNSFSALPLTLLLLNDPEGCWCTLQENSTHCLF